MQYLAIMHMLHSQTDLREPIKNSILRQVASFLFLLFYFALEITSISIVHDNTKLSLFSFINFFKMYDIWMIQHFQYFGFFHGILLFLFI